MDEEYFIGIDIGGTRIKLVLRSKDKILRQKVFSNYSNLSAEKLILKLNVLISNFLSLEKVSSSHLFRIGVGVPGIFEKNGTIINLPNLKVLNGVNFKNIFKSEFGKHVKVKIVNDAQLPYFYYKNNFEITKMENILFLTLGTSFGCCVCLNGKLFTNKFNSSEFAHSKVFGNKKTSDFISKEFLLSGFSGSIRENKENLPFEKYGEKLGHSISVLHNVFGFDKVVLTGGICNYKKYFADSCKKSFEKNSYFDICELEFYTSSFAGAIGASYLF